jgi:putative flippase GtrA
MKLDRIPRYVIVGAFCAGIYNVTMIAGDALGINYVVSTLVAFVVIVLVGYALHCLYTFSEKLSLIGLARYTGAQMLTLPFSIGGMFALHSLAGLPIWIATPLLTGLLFCWNFVATHWALVTRTFGRGKGEVAP